MWQGCKYLDNCALLFPVNWQASGSEAEQAGFQLALVGDAGVTGESLIHSVTMLSPEPFFLFVCLFNKEVGFFKTVALKKNGLHLNPRQ